MKITMDGDYQTRDGRDVRVYAVDCGGRYSVHGAVRSDTNPKAWFQMKWTPAGSSDCDPIASPGDLVEKPEIFEMSVWMNLYLSEDRDYTGSCYFDRETADSHAGPNRFACICIKRVVTKGEGL